MDDMVNHTNNSVNYKRRACIFFRRDGLKLYETTLFSTINKNFSKIYKFIMEYSEKILEKLLIAPISTDYRFKIYTPTDDKIMQFYIKNKYINIKYYHNKITISTEYNSFDLSLIMTQDDYDLHFYVLTGAKNQNKFEN